MRWIRPSALILPLLLLASPAASWEEIMYAELGLAKDFPSQPMHTTGTYDTEVANVGPAPTEIYWIEEDNIIFRMSVADMRAAEYVARSASILSECIYRAESEGDVLAKMPQRVDDGTDYRVYGHLTSVDLFDNQGRKQTNCFFTKGRLIKIEVIVSPEHRLLNTSQAIRFSASLRFRIDGTTYQPEP